MVYRLGNKYGIKNIPLSDQKKKIVYLSARGKKKKMKLKWESISNLQQNTYLIKLVAATLITCLAFRFFVFRFGQFSPVQVSVTGNSNSQISPTSVILSDNEDQIPVGKISIISITLTISLCRILLTLFFTETSEI